MKRVLTILAILLLPLSVWAMTPVSDSDLSNVTGQAGVNINADLTMNITIGTMAWGDGSGVDTAFQKYGWTSTNTNAGYVGITGFNLTNLRIKARETDGFGTGYALSGTNFIYTGAGTLGYSTNMLKPITIDVGSGALYGGQTFVRFGLGSLQFSLDALTMNVALGATGPTINQVLGTANLGPIAVYINPYSFVDIYTAAGVGVNFTFGIIIDQFTMTYMSWGDTDGAGTNVGVGGVTWFANSTAGYVGLQNLVVGGPIAIGGTVRIDVGTVAPALGIYAGAVGHAVSVVHISFADNFHLNVAGPITANVRLDSVAALNSANAGTLGDIYISGFGLSIVNGSWVDIWAH